MFKNLLIPKFSSLLFFPQWAIFFLAHYSVDKFLSDSVSTNIFIVLLLSDNMTETFREDSVKHSVVELSPLVMETSWKCFMKDGNEVCRSQTESWQWLLSPFFSPSSLNGKLETFWFTDTLFLSWLSIINTKL